MRRTVFLALALSAGCGDASSSGGGGQGAGGTGGLTEGGGGVAVEGGGGAIAATGGSAEGGQGGASTGGAPPCGIEIVPGGLTPDPTATEPQLFATDQESLWGLVADDTYLYWTNGSNPGRLVRQPRDGGALEALATDLVDPYEPFLDEGYVYFPDSDGTVKRVNADGGCVEIIATADTPTYLAFDSEHVYFSDFFSGAIGRAPKAGGEVTVLASGQANPVDLIVDDTHVYWVSRAGNVVGEGSFSRVAKTGGSVEVLMPGLTVPRELRWYQGKPLFFSDDQDGEHVFLYDPIAGTPEVLLQRSFTGVLVEGDVLYYGDVFPHRMLRWDPVDQETELALLDERPFYPAKSDTRLYWLSLDVGDVMGMSLP